MDNKNYSKTTQIFYCKICDYKCNNNSNYQKHLSTQKHIRITMDNKNYSDKKNDFECKICGKIYKFRSGLSKHKKTCKPFENEIFNEEEKKENNSLKSMFSTLMNENKELCKTLLEQQSQHQKQMKNQQELYHKQIDELIPKIGDTITNNNRFNMNVFLNDRCKDAINITEFIESLQIQLQDLENTKEKGLVQSISNIFIKGLSELDIHKRPIHCSDIKRDILYIKDEEKWEKDQQKDKIKQSINDIANKQRTQIKQWTDAHPNWMEDEKLKDEYVKLVNHLMQPVEDTEKEQNKIIKKVSAATIIGKEKE